MANPKRRRVWLALGSAAAALSLAGCVSMPSSGPPSSLPVNQTDAGQSQDYVGPFPAGPGNGWSPQQIVEGFLFASASYYTDGAVVREYLTPQAARTWNPGSAVTVFHSWQVTAPNPSSPVPQVTATVTGQVQATLNGPLYASVAQGSSPAQQAAGNAGSCAESAVQSSPCQSFRLVKSDGEWRISAAPPALLLNKSDFERAWEPQDLYFFDQSRQVLVPDPVFVPLGTSETNLLNNLAETLLNGPGTKTWLGDSVVNVFPQHIGISVIADPPTAIVNLKGKLTRGDPALPYIMAELDTTLTSVSVSQPQIQTVILQVNGSVWGDGAESPKARAVAQYDPYPSSAASFSYVDGNGAAQSACGSTGEASPGPAAPIFDHSGRGEAVTCAQAAPTAQPTPSGPANSGNASRSPKSGKTTANAYSMVAVSPDGKEVAVVSAGGTALSIGPVGNQSALKSVPLFKSAITSISWDRQHDLWLTQDGAISMVAPNGKPVQVTFGYDVTALSVAPDGVRVAMIVQNPSGNELLMAAINPYGSISSQQVPHGSQAGVPTIRVPVPLGPEITNLSALAWYDADHLVVANKNGNGSQLQEVPVDGRPASQQLAALQTPPGVTVASIAAGNAANMVVVGLTDGQLEASAGFEGPWQRIGPGAEPVYWIPPA
ncbi:MAG: GerMN domain-containing protein [Streptosporangiaceae bacterium]|nr:GerMN domain-containing protein [Streptosporangiaceae bacterium]